MTDEQRSLLYVELDLDRCQLRYGETNAAGTCQAVLGDTGTIKCLNTRPNCQDPPNYNPALVTYRYAMPTDFLPDDIPAIPNIEDVDTAPTKLNPGKGIGQREDITVTFRDHPYHDIGIDKYVEERPTGDATFVGALSLDGADDHVTIPQPPTVSGSPTLFTIEGWIKPRDNGETEAAILVPGSSGADQWITWQPANERLHVNIAEAADTNQRSIFSTGGSFPTDEWNHFAVVVDEANDSIQIYINGSLDKDVTDAGLIAAWSGTWYVGTRATSGTWWFEGEITDLRAWSDVRAQTEIVENMNTRLTGSESGLVGYWPLNDNSGTTARDETVNANDGTLVNGPAWVTSGPNALAPEGTIYEPFDQGTYWGKWRNRNRYYLGRPMRLRQGKVGDSLEQMEVRHYVIESVAGPTADGTFTVTGKDVLKLADDERAQAPLASPGELATAITEGGAPTDIDVENASLSDYPSSGHVRINSEVFTYTGITDTTAGVQLNGVTRAQEDTKAQSHAQGDTVQRVLEYSSMRASDILNNILVNYTKIPASRIPLEDWNTEDDNHIGRLYGGFITEPTPVKKLISELSRDAGFFIWDDVSVPEIKFRALRTPGVTAADVTDDRIVGDAPDPEEQPKKRVSQVWVFFGRRDPTEEMDDTSNYRSISITVDSDAGSSFEYDQDAIEKIFSRWINRFNKPAANDVGQRVIDRFRDPPRSFTFQLPYFDPGLDTGDLFNIITRTMQKETGAKDKRRSVVLSFERAKGRVIVEAEEFNFAGSTEPGADREVIIDSDTLDFNLRDAYDSIYPAPDSNTVVTCRIENGIKVGATNASGPSFDVGSWPAGVTITVVINGRIQGAGGAGGDGGDANAIGDNLIAQNGAAGQNGGTALFTRFPITVENNGSIWGGGGGGGGGGSAIYNNKPTGGAISSPFGGGGGGGGRGYTGGPGGAGGSAVNEFPEDGLAGSAGNPDSSGSGGPGGSDPDVGHGGTGGGGGSIAGNGAAGADGIIFFSFSGNRNEAEANGAGGGTDGDAVDGDSFVTYSVVGDIQGSQVN